MAFTTTLISSFTLTTSLLYLSILHHRRTRLHQAQLLNESTLLLNSLVSPQLASDIATVRDENFSGFAGREAIWPLSLYDLRHDRVETGVAALRRRLLAARVATEQRELLKDEAQSENLRLKIGEEEFSGIRRPWTERWKDEWNREVGAGFRWVFEGGLSRVVGDAKQEAVDRVKHQAQAQARVPPTVMAEAKGK